MNPYLILGALLAVLAAAVGGFFYGQGVGKDSANLAWQQRESIQLANANQKILDLTAAARAREQQTARELAEIAANAEKEKEDANRINAAEIARLRTGAVRLRVPITACQDARGSSAPGLAAPAGLGNGRASAELDYETAAALRGITDDGDAAIRQLGDAQQVIRAYYAACGGQKMPD